MGLACRPAQGTTRQATGGAEGEEPGVAIAPVDRAGEAGGHDEGKGVPLMVRVLHSVLLRARPDSLWHLLGVR